MSKDEEKQEYESPNIPIDQLDVHNVSNYDERLDSAEEFYFVHYMLELTKHGVILDADKSLTPAILCTPIKNIYTQILKTKTKIETDHLKDGHSYTPDFNCQWNREWENIMYTKMNSGQKKKGQKVPFITANNMIAGTTFEVKGDYTKPGQLQNTNLRIAWFYDKHQYFVQMVKLPKLFKATFTPQKYIDDMKHKRNNAHGKKGQTRLKYKPVLIKQYLENLRKEAEIQTPMI